MKGEEKVEKLNIVLKWLIFIYALIIPFIIFGEGVRDSFYLAALFVGIVLLSLLNSIIQRSNYLIFCSHGFLFLSILAYFYASFDVAFYLLFTLGLVFLVWGEIKARRRRRFTSYT